MTRALRGILDAARAAGLLPALRAALRRFAIVAAVAWTAWLLFVAAILWFDAALWFFVAPRLGAANAALIAGGALLGGGLIAVAVLFLSHRWGRGPRGRAAEGPGEAMELAAFFRDNKGAVLAAAAVAGLVLAAGSERRP